MSDYIPSDEMYKHIDCRYTGVVVAAKRARQLMKEDPASIEGKPLLRAFEDMMQGRLRYRFTEPLSFEDEYYEEYSYDPEEDVNAENAQGTPKRY